MYSKQKILQEVKEVTETKGKKTAWVLVNLITTHST